jgi:hypothetical protein
LKPPTLLPASYIHLPPLLEKIRLLSAFFLDIFLLTGYIVFREWRCGNFFGCQLAFPLYNRSLLQKKAFMEGK